MSTPKYWVLIAAAGIGQRMQVDTPKQYLPLAGKTVIEHALAPFLNHSQISGLIIVLATTDYWWPKLNVSAATDQPIAIAKGAEERYLSVINGLLALRKNLQAKNGDWVLVHDAARPCLRNSDLQTLMSKLADHPVGGLLATPVRDTLKKVSQHGSDTLLSQTTLDRGQLWHALTPQMFRLGLLEQALQSVIEKNLTVTDEAAAIEMTGYPPSIVEGHHDNIKITWPDDLALAEYYLQRRSS